MRTAPIVIADRHAAVGWRLAGAHVRTPMPGTVAAAFRTACAETELVLIASAYARELPPAMLDAARRSLRPLVLVLDDEPGAAVERSARRALGVLP